jgi:DNA-directed RNA polymerase specialized sigma24 family protein
MDQNALQSTNKLLKVIVALLLRGRNEETPNVRQQIEILHDLGLKPVEVAEILGRSSTHVNKELSGIRKSRKQKE